MIDDQDIQLLSYYLSAKDNKATATEVKLALGYKSVGSVNFHVRRLAIKLSGQLSYQPTIKPNGQFKWYPCLFDGEETKDGFVWTLKNSVIKWFTSTYSNNNDVFYQQIKESLNDSADKRRGRLLKAKKKPKRIKIETWSFTRNPDVVAEVLYLAEGRCQHCGKDAPFKRKIDNMPYLEVHHIIPLSKSGDDTVNNSIALCPNCHREKHFG